MPSYLKRGTHSSKEYDMTRVERSIIINAPADAIEAIIGDGRRLIDWYAGVEQADPDDVFPEPGGKLNVVYKAAGVTLTMKQTVLERVPGKGGVSQIEGIVSGTTWVTFTPKGQGTRVTMRLEYQVPGGGLGNMANRLLAKRINAHYMEKSLKNLKALVEGQPLGSPASGLVEGV